MNTTDTLKRRRTPGLTLLGLAVLSLVLNALTPLPAEAQSGASQSQILTGLSGRYRGLESLQASYSRVAKTPSSDQIFKSGSSQTAAGTLSWARPDRLLLDQKSPQPEVMVTDGQTVWWHIPSEKLVYQYSNIDVAGQLKPLLAFLSGLDSLNANFNVSQAPADSSRSGQYGLILIPKAGDGTADRLTVWCDSAFALTGFRMEAVTGETTDFYFSGLKENPRLNSRLFNFKIPRGTEVIEEQ